MPSFTKGGRLEVNDVEMGEGREENSNPMHEGEGRVKGEFLS